MFRNSNFQKNISLLCFAIILIFTIMAVCSVFSCQTALAENDPTFGIYADEKIDSRSGEYFVIGSGKSLSLVFDSEIDQNSVIVKSGDTVYPLSTDRKTVVLGILSGVNELTVEYSNRVEIIKISVGWSEIEGLSGVYYLPDENGWIKTESGFSSQQTDRTVQSNMRLLTKGVEYLSFSAITTDASTGRKDVCGTVSSSKNEFGVSRTLSNGAFVLNAEFDVVTLKYMPKSSAKENTAEMTVSGLSTEVEYISLTAEYDQTLGEIYYYDSRSQKTVIKAGANDVPKYFKDKIYFGSTDSTKNVKLFDYSFDNYLVGEEFEDGIQEYSKELFFEQSLTMSAIFKQGLTLTDYAPLMIKQNGVSETKGVKNGGTIELDYTVKSELTVGAPVLGEDENCDLYINGKLVLSSLKSTQVSASESVYAYSFGVIDSDTIFEFSYTKNGNYYPVKFVYTVKLISNNTIEKDLIVANSNITVKNDSAYPFGYLSTVPSNRVSYVPSNQNLIDTVSVISFTVSESGVFSFDYYMSTNEYAYCFVSVANELTFDQSTDFDALTELYGIGDEYGEYTKAEANHGVHGWRKKNIDITVDGQETIYVYFVKSQLYTPELDNSGDLFAISSVAHYVGNAVFSPSNRFSSSGVVSTTANGVSINESSTISVGSEIVVSATPNANNVFYGWISNGVIVCYEKDYSFIFVEDTQIEAVMQTEGYYVARDDNDFYVSLSKAVGVSDDKRKIILIADSTVDENLSIPENIEILLPFSKDDTEGYSIGSPETAGTRVSWTNESKYLYLTLTIADGVELEINGKFTVGAVQHYPDQSAQSHTSGAYSQIVNNGLITLNSKAYFDVVGLVRGLGRVNAKDGSIVRMPFIVNNFAGGTITLNYYTDNCFPFYNYALINIQCDYTLNYGAKLIGSASLFATGAINTQDIVVVNSADNRVDGGDGALYWIGENSSIDFSYGPKSVNVTMGTSALADSGVTTLTINGEVILGEFFFESMGFGSNDMILGLPYTFEYVIGANSTLIVPERREFMILPGGVMTVLPNGVLQINGGLYVLDGLIQKPLAGKSYPSVDQLKNNGFSASGMLIDNGTVNIQGSFAGIIQSAVGGANIEISPTAVLTKTIKLGTSAFSENNRVELTLTARVGGLRYDALTELNGGNTYRSYVLTDGTNYTLSDFTMDSAQGYSDLTFAINQDMQGYFGLVDGDKLEVERILSIGTAKKGVLVNVDDTTRMTDENGQIVLNSYVFAIFEYKTESYDVQKRTANDWNNLKPIVISVVEKHGFTADSDFERIITSAGAISKETNIVGTVTYYNGSVETVALTLSGEYADEYIQTVNFVSPSYTATWTCTIYTQRAALSAFIESLIDLSEVSSDNIVSSAVSVYTSYQTLVKGLDTLSHEYADGIINEKVSYDQRYKDIFVSFTVSNSVYGDERAQATAQTVDGRTQTLSVESLKIYSYENGVISADFVLNSEIELIEKIAYSVTQRYNGIEQKELVVTVDDNSATYGESMKKLTATADGLIAGDTLDEIVVLSCDLGENVGKYPIIARKSENAKSNYYSLVASSGWYTVEPKTVSVSLTAQNVMLSKANSEIAVTPVYQGDVVRTKYQITKNGVSVALYKDKKMTLTADGLTVGEYNIIAVSDDDNYILTMTAECVYSVVENKDYYEFDLGLAENKVYDGSVVELTPVVKVAQSDSAVDYVIKVNGSTSYEIKNAGVYNIVVSVDGYDYTATYTIFKKTLGVTWTKTDAVFCGSAVYPEYNIVGIDSTLACEFNVQPVNVGNYSLELSTSDVNYTFDGTRFVEFVVNPKEITLIVNKPFDMRLSAIKNGERAVFSVSDSPIGSDKLSYKVYSSDGICVFTVDQNGIIEVLSDLTVGEYTVKAVSSDSNYSVSCVSAKLNVIEDNNYYTVLVKYDGASLSEKVYDGAQVVISVDTTITETGEIVRNDRIAMSVEIGETLCSEIKGAGLYTVTVVIDDETTYIFTYKVSPRVAVLEWEQTNFVYNGSEQIPAVIVANAVDGDDVYAETDSIECVNSGTKTAFVKSLSGESSANYVLGENVEFEYTIAKKEISVSLSVLNVLATKIEETLSINVASDELSENEINFAIFQGDEQKAIVTNGILSIGSLTVGEYTVIALSSNDNYLIVNSSATLKIVEPQGYYDCDLGIADMSKVYDGESVEFDITVKVKQTGKIVSHEFGVNGSTEQIRKAGVYELSVKVSGATFEYVYTVEKKKVDVSWKEENFEYNGLSQIPDLTITGVVGSDEVKAVLSDFDSVKAGEKTVRAVSLTGKDSANYVLDGAVEKEYTIRPKTLNVTVSSNGKTYGDIDSDFVIVVAESIPSGDTLTSIISVSREKGENVGNYLISIKTVNSNYTIVYSESYFVISPKRVSVVIDNKKSTYGEELVSLTANADADISSDSYELVKQDGLTCGDYQIRGISKSKNYEFVFKNGVYTIELKNIELTVPDVKKTYGEAEAILVANLSSGYTLCYEDKISDLVSLSREDGKAVGTYMITANIKNNANYNITKISYTSSDGSSYVIEKRPITIKAVAKIVENGASYQTVSDIINDNLYIISDGSLVNSDELSVSAVVIYRDSSVTMTKDNFDDYFVIGEHTISLLCSHPNYSVTVESGVLTVTKAKVKVVDMQTEYIYDDGNAITVFDWSKNITGNLKNANDKSFDVVITRNGVTVESVTSAGVYTINVVIRHSYAFEFTSDSVSEYRITVAKKDISELLFVEGLPENGIGEYDPYASAILGECSLSDIAVSEVFTRNGEIVQDTLSVGKYKLMVTINDDNYQGEKYFEWQIVKKDISSEIATNGVENNSVFALGKVGNIEIVLPNKYKKLSVQKELFDNNGERIETIDEIGVYKYVVKVSDENYVGEKTISFEVIANYDELFENVNLLLTASQTADKKTKAKNVSAIRTLLQSALSDKEKIELIEEYKQNIQKIEEFFVQYVQEIERVSDSAKRGEEQRAILELIDALAVLTYFGIKQTL